MKGFSFVAKPPAFPYSPSCVAAGHKSDPKGKSCATCRGTAASHARIAKDRRLAEKQAQNELPARVSPLQKWAGEVCDALIMWCHSPQSLREEYLIGLIDRRPRDD